MKSLTIDSMSKAEKNLRRLVASVTPKESAVVAKVSQKDVDAYRKGELRYS